MRAIRLRAIPVDDFDAAVSEGIHGDGVFVFGWGAQDCHEIIEAWNRRHDE